MAGRFYFRTGTYGIEYRVSREFARGCSHQGQCDADIESWMSLIGEKKLSHVDPTVLAEILDEYTDWDTSDHDTNLRRMLWIIAGDINEGTRRCADIFGN